MISRLGSASKASRNCFGLVAGLHAGEGFVFAGEEADRVGVAVLGNDQRLVGLPLELDAGVVHQVNAGIVVAQVGAQVPGQQGMLLGGIVAQEQDGGRGHGFAQRSGAILLAGEGAGKGGVVGGAVVIDVVGAQHRAGKFLQEVVFFVGGAIGADDADGFAALGYRGFRAVCGRRAPAPAPN